MNWSKTVWYDLLVCSRNFSTPCWYAASVAESKLQRLAESKSIFWQTSAFSFSNFLRFSFTWDWTLTIRNYKLFRTYFNDLFQLNYSSQISYKNGLKTFLHQIDYLLSLIITIEHLSKQMSRNNYAETAKFPELWLTHVQLLLRPSN